MPAAGVPDLCHHDKLNKVRHKRFKQWKHELDLQINLQNTLSLWNTFEMGYKVRVFCSDLRQVIPQPYLLYTITLESRSWNNDRGNIWGISQGLRENMMCNKRLGMHNMGQGTYGLWWWWVKFYQFESQQAASAGLQGSEQCDPVCLSW